MERMRVARLCLITENKSFLLLRRMSGKYNGGLWELPGGKLEENELDWESALRREVKEETGIEPRRVDFVFETEEEVMFRTEKIIYNERIYRGKVGEEIGVTLSGEHTDCVWGDRTMALSLDLTLGTRRFLEQMREIEMR